MASLQIIDQSKHNDQMRGVNPCHGLTHWGRMTHICVSNLTIIGSDNGLSPERRQAVIWTNDGILLIGPLGTNCSEILIEILNVSFKNMRLKVSSAKWRPFCLGLNVLMIFSFGVITVERHERHGVLDYQHLDCLFNLLQVLKLKIWVFHILNSIWWDFNADWWIPLSICQWCENERVHSWYHNGKTHYQLSH